MQTCWVGCTLTAICSPLIFAVAAVTTSVPNEIHEFKEEIKNEFKSDLQEFSQKIDKKLSESKFPSSLFS